MALIAWYPLNGNLLNYGVGSDLDLIPTTASVFNSDGKIGKAFHTGGDYTWTGAQTAKVLNSKALSICFWVKINSTVPQSGSRPMFFGNNSPRKFSIFNYPTSNDLHWSWSGAGSQNGNSVITGAFPNGVWTHVVFTFEGTTGSVYLNGVLKQTFSYTPTASATFSDVTTVIRGCSYRLVNDYRFYNHCLSAKEVAELAKGLILHYPMNDVDGIIGGENLLPNSNDLISWKKESGISIIKDANRWFKTTYNGSGNNYGIYKDITLATNTTYTASIETQGGGLGVGMPSGSGNDPWWKYGHLNTTTPQQLTITFTTGADPVVRFYIYSPRQSLPISYIRNPKLELGSKATPWTPAPEDTPNWNTNIVYDAAGYRNNGTINGTIGWDSDAPLGYGAYVFDGSSAYISAGRGAMVTDAITVSAWIYCSNWANYKTAISCTEGGGWNFEPYSGKLNFALYKGGAYGNALGPTLSSISSGWHLITGTFDGYQAKCYLDGQLAEQESASSTKKTIGYNSGNGLFIGGEAAGNATVPASYCAANTKICDFRVYATALSAEAVLDLYQVKGVIDNQNRVKVRAFLSESLAAAPASTTAGLRANLSSTGILSAASFTEQDGNVKFTTESGVLADLLNETA